MVSIERNPFVGPQPLNATDGIHGRDEEIRELLWFFTAERIVWLHSPSGAGKTSLVQAGLIPRLEADDFEILPLIRVNREGSDAKNRYEASAVSCVAEASLDGGSGLYELLAERKTRKSRVLIFDQFEEILTLDSTDRPEKKSFFEVLGRVLRLSDIWALFVVREDFLPALDPYARCIPTLMNHRFRLDLLPVDKAREAMEKIALSGGRTFDPQASAGLAAELSRVRLHMGGEERWKQGPFVEPVILQVVCANMWKEMPADQVTIEKEHVPTGPKVSQSLAKYYADSVKSVSKTPIQERQVRTWIGERMITSGVRNQVLDASGSGAELGLTLVGDLVKTHLIRREDRGERTWYELAHDRLVEPVLQDNARWKEENLHWVQKRAALWRIQGRPRTLLLVDEDLKNAKKWEKDLQSPLTEDERDFLDQSDDAQKVRNKDRIRTRLVWIVVAVASALLLATSYSYLDRRSEALINLALREVEMRDPQIGCAAQHGREALSLTRFLGASQRQNGMEALEEVMQGYSPAYEMPRGENLILAFSPKASLLAIATPAQVNTYHVDLSGAPEDQLRSWVVDTGCSITAMSLNPTGDLLSFGLSSGAVQRVPIVESGGEVACGRGARDAVEALAFSETGTLASASSAGIRIGDRVVASEAGANAVVFGPGALLAAGMQSGKVQILAPDGTQERELFLGKAPVDRLAWHRGVLAAVSRSSGVVGLWANDFEPVSPLPVHQGGITAVAIAPDESVFVTAGLDQTVRIWRTGSNSLSLTLRTPPAKEDELTDLLFLDPTHLLVAYKNGAARLFLLDDNSLSKAAAVLEAANPCAGPGGSGSR